MIVENVQKQQKHVANQDHKIEYWSEVRVMHANVMLMIEASIQQANGKSNSYFNQLNNTTFVA